MKHINTILIGALAAYLGYYTYYNTRPQTQVAPSFEVKTFAEKVTPPPAPIVIEPVIAKTESPMARENEKPKNLAPPGVFYLVAAKSIATDSGIESFRVGTRVTKISGSQVKTDSGAILDASGNEISNDLDLVAFVSAIRNRLPAEPISEPPPLSQEEPTKHLSAKPAPSKNQSNYNNPLDSKSHSKTSFGRKDAKGNPLPFSK